jgi:lipopolysaccharide transport system ATP-binding protein
LLELGAGFNPEFTGRENVYLNATLLGLTREEIKDKYDEIVAFADIGSFIDQPVKHYSSGMYARLAFAVAISVDPQILIVDEALAVGDEPFQRKCFSRIEEIKSRGGSILLVSHAATTVVSLCDRAVLLHKGTRLFTGASKVAVHWYKKLMNASDESYEEIQEQLIQVESESMPKGKQILSTESIHQSKAIAREPSVSDQGGFDPDLESKSRLVYETNGAEISQIRIENLKGETVNELLQGSRYRVCYEVSFEDPQLSTYFRCMIKTIAGVEIGGASYPHPNSGGYTADAGETISLSFEFSCHLSAGTYFINCGVSDGVRTLHRILDALAFRVVSISDVLSIGTVDFLVDAALSTQTLQSVQSS